MTATFTELLHHLLGPSAPQPSLADSLSDWKATLPAIARQWPDTGLRAIVAGFSAPHLAFAFAAGYQAALERLTGHADHQHFYALCVTEPNGNRPRDIQTRLTALTDGWVLNGTKTYVTGAQHADYLLIAANRGEDDQGRPRISLVRVALTRPGITLTPLPALHLVPELPHARVALDQVGIAADEILSGDGYTDYVKPFRTLEDVHVELAICGHLLRQIPRESHYQSLLSRLLVALATLLTVADMAPLDPATHLLLAGQRDQLDHWLTDMEAVLANTNPRFLEHWLRDKALLNIAGAARAQRTQQAWQRLLGETTA